MNHEGSQAGYQLSETGLLPSLRHPCNARPPTDRSFCDPRKLSVRLKANNLTTRPFGGASRQIRQRHAASGPNLKDRAPHCPSYPVQDAPKLRANGRIGRPVADQGSGARPLEGPPCLVDGINRR